MGEVSRTLTLPLKGEYFRQIKAGTKPREYRLASKWEKRLAGKTFDRIVLTLGYPRSDDHERRLVLPWQGYERQTITHPHFGPDPVEVLAIDVTGDPILSAKGEGG